MSAPSLLTWAILLALVLHAAWRRWRHPSPLENSLTAGLLQGRHGPSPDRRGTARAPKPSPSRLPTRHGGRNVGARVATILVTTLLLLLNPTLAAPPSPGEPTLLPDPGVADAGTSIDVTGKGFDPHKQGVLTLDGDSSGMPAYRVRGNGTFDERLVIPADATPGTHLIGAATQDGNGRLQLVATAPTTVWDSTPPPPSTALPAP